MGKATRKGSRDVSEAVRAFYDFAVSLANHKNPNDARAFVEEWADFWATPDFRAAFPVYVQAKSEAPSPMQITTANTEPLKKLKRPIWKIHKAQVKNGGHRKARWTLKRGPHNLEILWTKPSGKVTHEGYFDGEQVIQGLGLSDTQKHLEGLANDRIRQTHVKT